MDLEQKRLVPDEPSTIAKRIAAAKKVAQARPRENTVGPEWPKAESIAIENALTDLCIAMFEYGLSISSGAMPDGMSVWVRLKIPLEIADQRAGTVAFTVSDTFEKALRKAVQMLDVSTPKVWKPDQFARGAQR